MKSLTVGILIVFCSYGFVSAESVSISSLITESVSVSSSTSVWPNYKEEFSMVGENLLVVTVLGEEFGNKYIASAEVILGIVEVYFDDFENPSIAVFEYSILGNDGIMRSLMRLDRPGGEIVEWQVRINDKWEDICLASGVEIRLLKPKRFLKKGKIKSILLIVRPLDSVLPIELELENKL